MNVNDLGEDCEGSKNSDMILKRGTLRSRLLGLRATPQRLISATLRIVEGAKSSAACALADVGLDSAAFKTFVRYAAFVESGRRLGGAEGRAAGIDLSPLTCSSRLICWAIIASSRRLDRRDLGS